MFNTSLICSYLLCFILNLVLPTFSSPPNNSLSSSIHLSCHEDERAALLHLKESFTFTHPYSAYPSTNKTRSWKKGTDCCKWEGIKCDPFTHHVIVLDLSNNGIIGAIKSNSTLFQLRHLQVIKLSFNNFTSSTISPSFGKFHTLKHLDLSSSEFSGRVPIEIAQLSHLAFLDLSWNNDLKFSNSEMIIGNLTQLRSLDLSEINLDSQILQSITNLSLLEDLDLSGCNLRGELPTSIFNLPHLRLIDLGFNDDIVFDFPSSYNWSSPLEFFYLTSTNFSSNIPTFFRQLHHLKFLDLSYSNLHGTIPKWVWNISEGIDLSGNKLTGGLPSTLNTTKLSNYTYLRLARNSLVGEVPSWLFSLKSLETIDLSYNYFSGNISLYNAINTLPKLQSLSLSSSGISVSLKDGPTNSSSTLGNALVDLELSNSSMYGEVPKWLQQIIRDNSINLDLSYNSLTGVLEHLPWGNHNNIHIDNNMLTGPLPIMSSPLTVWFSASNNNFTGFIDSSICNMTSLWTLDLSNNSLSGNIPDCLGSFSNGLAVLNLGSNNLHGTLPTNFSKCDGLQYLALSGNSLNGQLPRSLAQCKNLQSINLEGNNLEGEFPYWLHTLPRIQVLDLSSNRFYGHISNVNEKHPFSMLQILDLSNSNFSGKIPTTYIKNFRVMMRTNNQLGSPQYWELNVGYEYSISLTFRGVKEHYVKVIKALSFFDLSNNAFEGEIPECIGLLVAIQGLNLSHNHLTGRIPLSIGKLSSLNSLDLSSNMLTGHIPQELVSLTFLEVFNVSNNLLIGHIPLGSNFDTFSADSYEGNSELCGPPLLECSSNTPSANNNVHSQHDYEDDDGSTLSMWDIVIMGFGSGTVVGLAWGYHMFTVGRPLWFIRLVSKMEVALLDFCDKQFR